MGILFRCPPQVSHAVVALLTDAHSTPAVKRNLLCCVTQLAVFLR